MPESHRPVVFRLPMLLPCLLWLAAASGVASAHGDRPHLMGTVVSVTADRVEVEDREGTARSIPLGPETRYRDIEGEPVDPSGLRPGARVVVHFGAEGKPAAEIRFAPGAAAEATATPEVEP